MKAAKKKTNRILEIEKILDETRNLLEKFEKYQDIDYTKQRQDFFVKFQDDYEHILTTLTSCYDKIIGIQDIEVKDDYSNQYDGLIYSITYIYQQVEYHLHNHQIASLKNDVDKLNRKLENSLGTQFGIFSALLTILAFVLNNAKLLTYSEINFKQILLVNLSYILVCAVLFYFVLWFVKPYKHSKGRVWSLVVIIVVLAASICLLALL